MKHREKKNVLRGMVLNIIKMDTSQPENDNFTPFKSMLEITTKIT